MRAEILINRNKILKAITKLKKGGFPVNYNRISKVTGLDRKTIRRYYLNNFYI